jgi:ABC-type glycerol-3-phosphate transport system permease component
VTKSPERSGLLYEIDGRILNFRIFITVLPIMVLFFYAQKYLIEDISTGSVKG